jgi:hypothetical protein
MGTAELSAAAAKRKADTQAQEAAGIVCPLAAPPEGGCQVGASLEICAGRGIVQFTCGACGAGCAQNMPLNDATLLLEEMHAYRPELDPAHAAAAATDVPPPPSLDDLTNTKSRKKR